MSDWEDWEAQLGLDVDEPLQQPNECAEAATELPWLHLSMLLEPSEFEKVFCNDERRNDKGYVVVTCTRGLGHAGPHTDAHMGSRWEDKL